MESGNASDGCENYLDPDDGDYDLMNSGLESAGDASDWDEPKTISSKAVKRKSSKNYDKRAHINRDNWNEDMSAALIAQVERHPVIWDQYSPDFRNKIPREAAWAQVRTDAMLLHIEDGECRRKWQHLKSNHNRLCIAFRKSGSVESAKPGWAHWNAMAFDRINKPSSKKGTRSNLIERAGMKNEDFDEGDDDPLDRPANARRRLRQVSTMKPSHATKLAIRRQQKSYRHHVDRTWTPEEIGELLAQVEARPNLWDLASTAYKQCTNKYALWMEVAAAIPASVNDCKAKWGNMRTAFNSILNRYRRKKASDSAGPLFTEADAYPPVSWKYFKPMIFLESNIKELNAGDGSSDQLATFEFKYLPSHSPSRPPSPTENIYDDGSPQRMRSPSPDAVADSSPAQYQRPKLERTTAPSAQHRPSVAHPPATLAKEPSDALCEYIAAELKSLTPAQALWARSKLRRAFNDIFDEAVLMT